MNQVCKCDERFDGRSILLSAEQKAPWTEVVYKSVPSARPYPWSTNADVIICYYILDARKAYLFAFSALWEFEPAFHITGCLSHEDGHCPLTLAAAAHSVWNGWAESDGTYRRQNPDHTWSECISLAGYCLLDVLGQACLDSS